MKTIREQVLGKATLRLLEMDDGYAGIVISKDNKITPLKGDDPDVVWADLVRAAGQSNTGYFGFAGAIARFEKIFPSGFSGPAYIEHERTYKLAARDLLQATLSVEQAMTPTTSDCAAAARVFSKTNMLSQFEQARVNAMLKSAQGPEFLRGSALIASGDHAQAWRWSSRHRSHMGGHPGLWRPICHFSGIRPQRCS